MNKEESTIFSTFVLCLLIILFTSTEIRARKLQQICSSSCGDIKNISYPFRLKGDPAGCGDPDYELSCESNKTMVEVISYGSEPQKYYVKRISYDERTINFVDVNFVNGSCSLPPKSISRRDMIYRYDFRTELYMNIDRSNSYASFVNCSRYIEDKAYRPVPCLSKNQSNIYVSYRRASVSDLPMSCFSISVVPILFENVGYPSYETIRKLLESGFEYKWSVECRDCIAAGGACNNEMRNFECYKSTFISDIFWRIQLLFETNYRLRLSSELAVGVLITARFILPPIVLFAFLMHKYRKTKHRVDQVEKFLHNQQSRMPKRYTYPEMIAMTNNFQDKLGQGGFGSVYRGQLHTGHLIAVKMLNNSKFNAEEFINEVSTIGRIHHVNVVQLLGFCSEGSKRALVYEYMPNGSLDRHIFSKKGEGQPFSWEKLHEIALGTTRGIEYLHGGCDVCILHFDIKPHNILLDHNFIPKVSDFGLAKFHPKDEDFVSVSATRGTIGYIAPELISRNFGTVSCKSDVYSFGMLLLEMAGGRRNSNMMATRSSKAYFPSWVYDQINKGGDLELPIVSEIESMIARKLCIIGLWCIQVKAADRPTMTKVLEMLEGNIEDLQIPPKPFFSSSPQHISGTEFESHSDISTKWLISESIEEYSFNNNFV